jgi:hypothetical protein
VRQSLVPHFKSALSGAFMQKVCNISVTAAALLFWYDEDKPMAAPEKRRRDANNLAGFYGMRTIRGCFSHRALYQEIYGGLLAIRHVLDNVNSSIARNAPARDLL